MPVMPTSLADHLLVALPSLLDATFARSVALICQHDENGAMGVLVNQPSEYTLGEVLAQMDITTGDGELQARMVLNGGPVHPERGFVIHDDARVDSSLTVGDGLYLTTSRDILEAMARGEGPANAVVTLGCAGWGAGQLESELSEQLADRAGRCRAGVPAAAGAALAGAARIGVDLFRLTDYSGHV